MQKNTFSYSNQRNWIANLNSFLMHFRQDFSKYRIRNVINVIYLIINLYLWAMKMLIFKNFKSMFKNIKTSVYMIIGLILASLYIRKIN